MGQGAALTEGRNVIGLEEEIISEPVFPGKEKMFSFVDNEVRKGTTEEDLGQSLEAKQVTG